MHMNVIVLLNNYDELRINEVRFRRAVADMCRARVLESVRALPYSGWQLACHVNDQRHRIPYTINIL